MILRPTPTLYSVSYILYNYSAEGENLSINFFLWKFLSLTAPFLIREGTITTGVGWSRDESLFLGAGACWWDILSSPCPTSDSQSTVRPRNGLPNNILIIFQRSLNRNSSILWYSSISTIQRSLSSSTHLMQAWSIPRVLASWGLQSLNRGKCGARHCSPMLVNATLKLTPNPNSFSDWLSLSELILIYLRSQFIWTFTKYVIDCKVYKLLHFEIQFLPQSSITEWKP